jgi:hypothetical protein
MLRFDSLPDMTGNGAPRKQERAANRYRFDLAALRTI